jgi:23S rRNA (adenine2503-C2)-methyltransferase
LYKSYWSDATDFYVLPADLRSRLDREYMFNSLTPAQDLFSNDKNTHKVLFQLRDGKDLESVMMSYHDRNTICVSTQSGCAMGCTFCATGQMGYVRNLSVGEIIEQVVYFARELQTRGDKITNIVFMGMGEPFHNYLSTMSAVDRLIDRQALGYGARRITISTVGLIPEINKFTEEKRQVNLAISLHAADDGLRSNLLPVNKKYPLRELIKAGSNYVVKTHRRITFEWALIHQVNDTIAQARKLVDLLSPIRIGDTPMSHVNLIPLNPTPDYNGKPTKNQAAEEFKKILLDRGISCTIRIRRGIDIQAGCGQLAIRKK